MISRTLRFSAVVLGLLCIAAMHGCGASESSVAGTYELDKEALKAAAKAEMEKEAEGKEDDGMAEFGNTMMLGMIEQMNMTLTLNEDGTATAVMSMMGDTSNATGTWTLDGESITISLAEEGDTPDSATGTVDGDTISIKPPGEEDMPFSMIFRKKQA